MTNSTNQKKFFQVKNLSCNLEGHSVLKDVSFSVKTGDILGIIGKSGAGKSTLIRCLNGLEKIDSGSVLFNGINLAKFSPRQWQKHRKNIGFIFQSFNLLATRTVIENVAIPLKLLGHSLVERQEKALELLKIVGLSSKTDLYPAQLSGGQKQRVAIARALINQPSLLLSDESTSALDPQTTKSILDLLKKINHKLGVTILLVTHEMDVIHSIANRVLVLENGQVVEENNAWNIFAHPKQPATKALVATRIPKLPPVIRDRLKTENCKRGIVFVKISGRAAESPFLNDLEKETSLSAVLIYGNIDLIKNLPIGNLYLSIPSHNPILFNQAITWLSSRCDSCKVLGYV